MTTHPSPTLRSIRVLLVTLALALAATAGIATGDAAADVLTPAVDAGGAGGSGEGSGGVALSANTRSILPEEGKLAPGGRLADWSDVEAALAPQRTSSSQTIF